MTLNVNQICVVLDTNLLISALLKPGGLEDRVLTLVRMGYLPIGVSEPIFDEYADVLSRRKFKFEIGSIHALLTDLRRVGLMTKPLTRVEVSPDDDDNRFLECAEAIGADYLVTGNLRHFPNHHGRTRILNARAFLLEAEAPTPSTSSRHY